ncbi:unnamed protein product [Trichobilharzia regenti]|nr:unnamed protein product [Trichobilharzia regenti]
MTYSTSLHGFSLRSLYRRCANSLTEASEDDLHNSIHSKMKHTRAPSSPHASNQPCIITIRTSNNEVSFNSFPNFIYTYIYIMLSDITDFL